MPNQTRNIATNTFTKGLIMDFDPTVTQNDRLVNALNATLLTFNGNEMTLQQDMGNGRVETAFLPEGYVPVGTCEFGDIIYIVSYNPLENKSQIGCFPSPERNITSDEISDLQQAIENSDFQEETNGALTGVLNATSVKKIVYGNNNMNPGDKYVVYTDVNAFSEYNQTTLTDFGNTAHKHDMWPKLLKLSVVAIEDSGKIVDLNASVKWYDNDYYLNVVAANEETPDIDSYRSAVSSAYSIFQSKVSGKLAILAELETIDEFSCTYDVYIKSKKTDSSDDSGDESDTDENDTQYHIYFYTSWETSHNDVNPSGFLFTKSDWTTEEHGGQYYTPVYQGDGVVKYDYTGNTLGLPFESAWTDKGWDCSGVREYKRIYKLDDPSITYEKYITSDSYNAQIDDIINWKKETESDGTVYYRAVASEYDDKVLDPDQLRMVSKVSRLLNDEGEPYADKVDGGWKYVYNLDYIDDSDDKYEGYYTKLFNGERWPLESIILTDDVVNNWFKKDIPTLITDTYELQREVTLNISDDEKNPVYQTFENDLSKLIWNYEVAPVMPYGVLDYMAIAGQIDFSKLGSGIINITDWRYYNSGSVSTLTWGLEVYSEPNKGVAEVVFDFFDNQGYAASWHTSNKTSYSGTFTDTIVLNQKFSSYKMNITDATGDSDHIHAGDIAADGPVQLTTNNRAVPTGWSDDTSDESVYGTDCYEDNAGMLVSNCLYLVKITVKYCTVDLLDNYDTDNDSDFRVFYRWYWTNGMLNESYYNVRDFDVLIPQLQLDDSVTFDTRGTDTVHPLTYSSIPYYHADDVQVSELDEDGLCKTLGAQVYAINQKGDDDENGNILMTVTPSITEPFDTFNLNKAALGILNVTCSMGESSITKTVDTPSLQYTGDQLTTGIEDNIQPMVATELRSYNDEEEDKGFDRSGYVSYDYGSNYKCVGNSLLTLLEVSRDKPYEPVDGSGGEKLPDTCQELYDTKNAYESYLDSFSLNLTDFKFVTPTDETDSLTYYDSNGSEKTVDWYQYKTLPADEAMDDTKGFTLSLAGIAYSKINSAKYDSTEVKMLRSVIRNCTGETYSPEMLGLHNYTSGQDKYYHLYFTDMIGFVGAKHRGAKHMVGHIYSSGISGCGWEGDSVGNSEDKKGKSTETYKIDFTDSYLQDLWTDHVRYPFTAFVLCKTRHNEYDVSYSFSSNSSWNSLKETFKYPSENSDKKYIHNESGHIPTRSIDEWAEGRYVVHTFAIRSSDGTIVPIDDWFISHCNGSAVQNRQNTYDTTDRGDVPVFSLGDMIGSLFAQLYVVDPSTHVYAAILSDTVTLQDYTEYWNKDIVIDMDVKDNASNEDIHDLLCIQQQTMTNYLNFLQLNSGVPDFYESEKINTYNIDISLVSARQTIAFQYAVPYDLGDLILTYENLSSPKNRITLSYLDESTSELQTESFRNSVTENTLYTWDGEEAVPFSSSSIIYYAEGFGFVGGSTPDYIHHEGGELYMIKYKDETMNTAGFNDLINIMNYNDGTISWGDYTSLTSSVSTYDVRYKPITGAGHNENYTCLDSLPRTSFFRFHNPQ